MLPKDLKMFNVIPLDNVLAKIPTSAWNVTCAKKIISWTHQVHAKVCKSLIRLLMWDFLRSCFSLGCTCNKDGTVACLAPTGTCLCNEQHTGVTCNDCATNYYRDPVSSACTSMSKSFFFLSHLKQYFFFCTLSLSSWLVLLQRILLLCS